MMTNILDYCRKYISALLLVAILWGMGIITYYELENHVVIIKSENSIVIDMIKDDVAEIKDEYKQLYNEQKVDTKNAQESINKF